LENAISEKSPLSWLPNAGLPAFFNAFPEDETPAKHGTEKLECPENVSTKQNSRSR
jgi:hypothetical protein